MCRVDQVSARLSFHPLQSVAPTDSPHTYEVLFLKKSHLFCFGFFKQCSLNFLFCRSSKILEDSFPKRIWRNVTNIRRVHAEPCVCLCNFIPFLQTYLKRLPKEIEICWLWTSADNALVCRIFLRRQTLSFNDASDIIFT